MKILTFVVPCYNSQDYMRHCLDTVVSGGERVEVIVVNDGSKDNTEAIALEYMEKYPSIVRVISQENGGHGEAVNTGIRNATGKYFKVVDSDDCISKKNLTKILEVLGGMMEEDNQIDMLLSNFVYDKQGAIHKKVMRYRRAMQPEELLTWDSKIHFNRFQYILMHSVIYRTELLRECELVLPKHTFYVDNIYVFKPLAYVKKFYYLDLNFYKYFIGRDDQSVNEKVMISRIDQQIRVNKIMIDMYSELWAEKKFASKVVEKYMLQYLDMMMCVSSIMLILSGTEENLEKKDELWTYLRETDRKLYKKLRTTGFGIVMNLKGKAGRSIAKFGYKVSRKIYGFN